MELGSDVVVSGDSNRNTLLNGSQRLISDSCLPLKYYVGHVVSLLGRCDLVFVPVFRSVGEKTYNCSRFLGLPDLTRAVVPEIPAILEFEFDLNRGRSFLYSQILNLGLHFSRNPLQIHRAALHAWEVQKEYCNLMVQNQWTFSETVSLLEKSEKNHRRIAGAHEDGKIGIIGHSYIINDSRINHHLLEILMECHMQIVTPEMLTTEQKLQGLTGLVSGLYWDSEEDIVGAAGYLADNGIDGIIAVTAFGCGPDSLMMHLVQEYALGKRIPFLKLTLEEHTAEAGMITRLEAFLDVVKHRKRIGKHACNIS